MIKKSSLHKSIGDMKLSTTTGGSAERFPRRGARSTMENRHERKEDKIQNLTLIEEQDASGVPRLKMPEIPNRYGMVVKQIEKAYKTETNRNLQLLRSQNTRRVADIDLSKVLGIAKHRLGTPINSMLDDEISVS